ncbi:NADP-dependent oxidoreductase [Aeromicrobium endophyticum]|uniref:NADP-dependent oxidoreductase n=1 Tax=Aeromicrobium endophyticum TaxID=2292704 RepID=A0A371PEB9_9ACTN|nr:NADP-dependent oxidoreductase [Aeromicrobium endophyticum]REK73996.1 NADP-dependent oxidoreductase [Aeromicrobium endophyticum]
MSNEAYALQVSRYPVGQVGADDFELVPVDLPEVADGQVLVRTTWTSVDPGLRLRLRADAPEGYFPAFPLHQPMDGIVTIGVIEESRAEGFPVGATVWHSYGWRTHAVVDAGEVAMNGLASLRVLDVDGIAPQTYLGPMGPMGLTAYAGLHVIGAIDDEPRTIWVSAAAGAVGVLVCQMARQLGHRVVASAGTDEKVRWLLDEIGVDAAFDRHDGPLGESLAQAAPEGIDLYFDAVGGDHLEAALAAMRPFGRIALCGSVGDYEREPAGPRNLFLATSKNLTMRGYRGSSYVDLLDEMQRRVRAWIQDGSVTVKETVYDGLDQAPRALADLMAGRTTGKTLVRVGD